MKQPSNTPWWQPSNETKQVRVVKSKYNSNFFALAVVIALIAGIAAMVFEIAALGLAVSAMVALLSAGLILFETSRIVNGGENNYVLATVGLYVSVFNLFTSLLSLFGIGGSGD